MTATADDLEKKIDELSNNYKLIEFNSEFSKFKAVVYSCFTVFCVMFASFFGYSYTKIPNKVHEEVDQKIGKDVEQQLDKAVLSAQKIIAANDLIESQKKTIAALSSKVIILEKDQPRLYKIQLSDLKRYNQDCEEAYFSHACNQAVNDFCQDKFRTVTSFGSIKIARDKSISAVCIPSIQNNTNS